jgi:transposase-like protein
MEFSFMSTNRNTYSASLKAKVAVAAVKQEKTISQLASQFNVHPLVVSKWKAQLLNRSEEIFQDGRKKPPTDQPDPDSLYRKIGQLEMELDWLKKKTDTFD